MELRREAWAGDMDLFGSHPSRAGNRAIKLRGSPKSVCKVSGKRKKNGKQRQETHRGVHTASKKRRRKRRTVARAAGAQVRVQDVATWLSTTMAIGILREASVPSRQQGDYKWSWELGEE